MAPDRSLPSLQLLEAFHVRLLLQLSARAEGALYLKGGVALRLFYGSERYSEDMDFDAEPFLRERLKRTIPRLLEHPTFLLPLRSLGLRQVEVMDAPAKDTGTTLRFKMGLRAGGSVTEPTKVEISFRGGNVGAVVPPVPAESAVPEHHITRHYLPDGTDWSAVRRYPLVSAYWQKVRALALRSQIQARDVFDLYLLGTRSDNSFPVALLRQHLSDELLTLAEQRAVDVSPAEFRETVVRYLPTERRTYYSDRWDDMQTEVAYRIATIRRLAQFSQNELTPDDTTYGTAR